MNARSFREKKSYRRTRVGLKPKFFSFFRDSCDLGTQNYDFVCRANPPHRRSLSPIPTVVCIFHCFLLLEILTSRCFSSTHTDVSGCSAFERMVRSKALRSRMMMLPATNMNWPSQLRRRTSFSLLLIKPCGSFFVRLHGSEGRRKTFALSLSS